VGFVFVQKEAVGLCDIAVIQCWNKMNTLHFRQFCQCFVAVWIFFLTHSKDTTMPILA